MCCVRVTSFEFVRVITSKKDYRVVTPTRTPLLLCFCFCKTFAEPVINRNRYQSSRPEAPKAATVQLTGGHGPCVVERRVTSRLRTPESLSSDSCTVDDTIETNSPGDRRVPRLAVRRLSLKAPTCEIGDAFYAIDRRQRVV